MAVHNQENSSSNRYAIPARVLWCALGVGVTIAIVSQLTVHPDENFDTDLSHGFHVFQFAWLAPLLARAAKWRAEAACFSGAAVVLCLHYAHVPYFVSNQRLLTAVSALIAFALILSVPLFYLKKFPYSWPSSLTISQLWAAFASYAMFAFLHWPQLAAWQLGYDGIFVRAVVGVLLLAVAGTLFELFFDDRKEGRPLILDRWALIVPFFLLSLVAFTVFKPSSNLDHSWLDLCVSTFSCYILLRIIGCKSATARP